MLCTAWVPGLLNLTGEKSYRKVSMYERVLRVGGGESNRKVSMYERVLRVGGGGGFVCESGRGEDRVMCG